MFSTHKKGMCIAAVILLLILAVCAVFIFRKTPPTAEETESALARGEAILREEYPDYFAQHDNVDFEGELNKGIWEVRTVFEGDRIVDTRDGWIVTAGGGIYVRFKRKTGEIVKVGMND